MYVGIISIVLYDQKIMSTNILRVDFSQAYPLFITQGGGSALKGRSIQRSINHMNSLMDKGFYASLDSESGAKSLLNEQPMSWFEMERGAFTRNAMAHMLHPGADLYLAIENGIALEEESYEDSACCMAYVPGRNGQGKTLWVRSEGVKVPAKAVRLTAEKEGGFELHTVGKTLIEMGYEGTHDDWHAQFHPQGKSRETILFETVVELFKQLLA